MLKNYENKQQMREDSRNKSENDRYRRRGLNTFSQSGRSMIEMLGVLAIVGVLSVGGIAGYSKAMTKFKTNQIADQVSTIVTNIKTLYAQQKDYSGLNNESAYLMGVFSDELFAGYGYYGGYGLTNPFNGAIYVYSSGSTVSAGDEMAFIVTYHDLPKETCISLATNNWNSKGFVAMAAGSGTFNYDIDNYLDYESIGCSGETGTSYNSGAMVETCEGSMSPDNAAFACDCEGNTCAVGWKYY